MDNSGRGTPSGDQNQKQLSISLAASSMINASDVITPEAYQANLQRIQEVKEMVRMLERNNDAAHKNFQFDQLQKRAKEGREAEDMLARLAAQQGIYQTVQFANNDQSGRPDVILPTTATLVEVPDPLSSHTYRSPAPATASFPLHTVHQSHIVNSQRSHPIPVQPHHPDVLRYHMPPNVVRKPPEHSAVPHPQVSVSPGQMSWYTVQKMPPQSTIHGPQAYQAGFQQIAQAQQVPQPWSSYPPQAPALPTADTVPTYHASLAVSAGAALTHGGPSTGSENPVYHEPSFAAPSTVPQVPLTTHKQSRNLASFAPTFQVQMPPQSVPTVPVALFDQSLSTLSRPKLAESQLQPASTAVSKPVPTFELQRPHTPPQQLHPPQQLPQRHYQQPQVPQSQPQPPLELQQHPQQPQTWSQHPQSMQQSQRPKNSLLSQSSLQLPPIVPPQSTDRARPVAAFQPSQPADNQEQGRQRGSPASLDQAMFIKLFRVALQRESWQFKAFWSEAKAAGISDAWFNAAINSVPRDLWQSVVARANQSPPMVNAPPPASAPQQQGSRTAAPSVPAVSPQLPQSAIHPVCAMSTIQPTAVTQGRLSYSSPGQPSVPYAAQLQYYAEQANKSAFAVQVASTSTTPLQNIALPQNVSATPKRDIPPAQPSVRTPKDANKSTLARDILHSLGKIVPRVHEGARSEPTDRTDNRECEQAPEVVPLQPDFHATSPTLPATPAAASVLHATPTTIPSESGTHEEPPQYVATPGTSAGQPVLKEEHGQVATMEGPIMIDLTLEDSDGSVDGKEEERPLPIEISGGTASLQPVLATNTTHHTPLLESLSLEESLADVAADSHNVDLPVHSPPLSFATAEDTESELLYPPPSPAPSGVDVVPASFEPPSREASEHTLQDRLPLFLPSPPISPVHSESLEAEPRMVIDDSEKRSLKRGSIDADAMDIDTELMAAPVVRKRRKQQVYVLIPPAPLYVKNAKLKDCAVREGRNLDMDGVQEDEELRFSHLEQLLIEESKSRLLERRCRWSGCGAILNCAGNLLAHLKIHAGEEDSEAPFGCRWGSCQRQFGVKQERDVHLERHTIRPLPCPFAGCDDQFDRPVEVMQHEVQHQKADAGERLAHKPTCQPRVPAIPARLGRPPQQLASHRVIPRRVVKCRITADRHAIVGPWILWNIYSPVELNNMRRQNASMRGRPMRQGAGCETDGRDGYEFLLADSSYPGRNVELDELDSTEVTRSVARGLTLW